ncbi:uncharacterized protein NECHADRAFT_77442 [Fusarium vanettenii 77-13-4]|uniref:GIY-YIG domain-containing protein n=1 Tax=Fusarium vanettenii (strain ATCC MYA-4622 / CBS 123669 / FGSC 9596 / NRRL 45880 / 77-13-4) TaxID=660122 RepID=C7YL86_FUSV7|nr:uncharacterized protein NECHADRAFT_77442 [Fusarium vanettenii 77-13-4]EEU47214.1 predicted protein [Fusarium vanettenii 77-13-4]
MSCGWHVVGKFRFVFILTSSTDLIPLVVLPTNILQEGRTFRTLAKQTDDLLGMRITPSANLQLQLSGSVFDNFVRSFWSSVAKETGALRQLLLKQSDMDEYFGGPRLRDNVEAILSAVSPEVREVPNDGKLSLQDLLDLPHVYPHMTLPGPCIYLRICTHLEGQSADSHGDATDGGINHGVAFYVGKAKDIWRRARQHETNTENRNVAGLHYSTARKSSREHRHMIPLLIFQQATVPEAVMNMAEQTMVVAFRCYQGWLFRPVQADNAVPTYAIQQHRAQFMSKLASVDPPRLQYEQPIVRVSETSPSPMHPYGARGSSVYQDLHDVSTSANHLLAISEHWDPTDAKRGYLVFEIMDDKKPHPRAWIGVPSVGSYENFDQASSLAVRFEWYDEGRRTWCTVPLQRVSLLRKPRVKYVREGAIDKILSGWRLAMTLIQALEGIVYQEPLNGFAKEVIIGQVDLLQTDHLNQRYRWVSRPKKALPAPALAIWEENYNLMHQLFDTPLTHVGTSEPLQLSSDVVNRAMGDLRGGKMEFKCDTCNYMAAYIICTRDESRTDCWATTFNRPTGPHRYMAFHHTMTQEQLCQVRVAPVPLAEKLGLDEEDMEEEEAMVTPVVDDGETEE